jgi:hypothetical protein
MSMARAVCRCPRRAPVAVAAIGLVASLAVPWSLATPAGADTLTSAATDLTCTATDPGRLMSAVLPPVTATDSRDAVPEDDLVEVAVDASLPALGDGVTMTGAALTLAIPTEVANVDLRFQGGNLPALSWDATSGTQISVAFRSPTPMVLAEVRLPTIIVSYALDVGSAGRTVPWPNFDQVVVTVVRDDVPGLVACRTRSGAAPINSTLITAPVGLVRRGAPGAAVEGGVPDAGAAGAGGAPSPVAPPGAGEATGTGAADGATEPAGGDSAGAPDAADPAAGAPVDGQPLATALPDDPAPAGRGPVNLGLAAAILAAGAALVAVFARRPVS